MIILSYFDILLIQTNLRFFYIFDFIVFFLTLSNKLIIIRLTSLLLSFHYFPLIEYFIYLFILLILFSLKLISITKEYFPYNSSTSDCKFALIKSLDKGIDKVF